VRKLKKEHDMKIFSLRNILGVAAIYGVTQYAKKQGGFRPALDNAMDKLRNLSQQAREQIGVQERSTGEVSTGPFETGGYTGSASEGAVSGDVGGGGSAGQPR
jgi:hypothetical protein